MKKLLITVVFSVVLMLSNVGSIFAYNDKNIVQENIEDSINIDEDIAREVINEISFQNYIEKNWDNLDMEKDQDLYNATEKSVGKPGDILIAAIDDDNYDINAIKVGSLTTHAALVDKDPNKVLEVLPSGTLSAEVKHVENDWRTRYKKFLIVRPIIDEETIDSAIEYGYTKIKTPFNFNIFNKTIDSKLYCSQFVWKCYMNAGIDLDRTGGKAVFPYDFISEKTKIVYKQGK